MKEFLECAAKHWVFSCMMMTWIYFTVNVITGRIYNSILVSMNALVKMQGWEDE